MKIKAENGNLIDAFNREGRSIFMKDPIVEEVKYDHNVVSSLNHSLEDSDEKRELIMDYPTDYVIYYSKKGKTANTYEVYVGETNNIGRRTLQHLDDDPRERKDWERLANVDEVKMLVIGHEHFNKSLTLDIENRLMLYLSSVDAVKKLNNRRSNSQNKYYTSTEMEKIFTKLWRKLNKRNQELFPLESIIREKAIFKASPFHSLTKEQSVSRERIMDKVSEALKEEKRGQLIFVEGEAGSGKTVLLSSLFYLLSTLETDVSMRNYLLVNHDQQLKVYQEIAVKLGLTKKGDGAVSKPTHFINTHSPNDPVDVILVDEAHLLWTQGKMSYRGENQLVDLLKRARVVIVIFDKHQTLTTEEYWEDSEIDELRESAKRQDNLIQLRNQMRMDADPETVDWVKSMVYDRKLSNIPKDSRGYDLKIMTSPENLENEIRKHVSDKEIKENGLSRMLATYDWKYIQQKHPDNGDEYWNVEIGDWKKAWNLQLKQSKEEKRNNKSLSWAEQPQTINEVGSTYTIQGFDLNYSGVIIGPSVKYRNGRIIYDPEASFNSKATQNRTLKDHSKIKVADELLANELNVLLTRGVRGLYIYAVDEELQSKLLQLQKEKDYQ